MKKSYRFTLVVAMFAALLFGGANNACSQNYVEIGNGTDETVFFPVMAHLANSASQQLYLASDIGSTPMEINAIAFHHKPYSSTTAAATRSVKVYLTATSERYITQQGGWLSVPSSDIYYQGSLNLPAGDEWVTINLSSSFNYDGHSNILVTVIDNTGQAASGGMHSFCLTLYDGDDTRAMCGTNTGSNSYGPNSLSQISGLASSGCANIRFYTASVELLTTKKWYGFKGYYAAPGVRASALIEFTMQNPGQPIEVAYLPDIESVKAAEYVDGKVYFVTNDKKLYKASFSAGNTSLADYEMIGELPYTPFDMSYNPVNHTMYYVSNGGGYNLYSINLQNGGTTLIGQLGDGYLNRVKNIAINSSGEAYGIYSEDTYEGAGAGILCRINLNDASLTHIGNTGRNASYGWTMAFDRETGELFWPQIGEALDDYGLYKVNTQTGSTSLLGKIGEGGIISLGGLFGIESSGVAIQSADATTEVSVFPNPTNGVVNVTAAGLQRIEAMDITGRTVAVSTSQTIDISAQPNGIYMLRIVTDGGTTVRKVVKQ